MIDPQLLLLGGAVAAIALAGFFAARFAGELFSAKARALPPEEPDGVLVQAAQAQARPLGWSGRFDRRFEQVVEGAALGMSPAQALGWIFLLGASLGVMMFVLRDDPLLTIFGFVLGTAMVLGALMLMQHRRRRQMQEQLPDTLYFLARSLRAGLSLEQAIELVGQQGMQPLAGELARASSQIKLGLPVVVALERMAARVQLLDFDMAVSTVAIFQKSGGNLSLLLDRVAVGAREHNQFRGQLRTATALGRVAAFAIALATPLFLLAYVLFQPTYSQNFFNSPTGWMIMLVAFSMELIGLWWIYRLTQIEY